MVTSVEKIDEAYNQLSKDISYIDLYISDLEHEIEFTKFDIVNGYKLCRELQLARISRREYKDEMAKVQKIKSAIKHKIDLSRLSEPPKEKTYTYRVFKQGCFKFTEASFAEED